MSGPGPWPATAEELIRVQEELAAARGAPWRPDPAPRLVGGCFVCFPRDHAGRGARGDPAWAAAVLLEEGRRVESAVIAGRAPAPYEPGLLALREGPLLEEALRALSRLPEVLLVNATGRDHPRGAGLALHLGARLGVPTIGVTRRPLAAEGKEPAEARGATSPLRLGGAVVGYWVRTRRSTRPLAAHGAWRTDPEAAVATVLALTRRRRTPEPLRQARRAAREARDRSSAKPE
jgi:deoxyribonuclease V